MSAKRRPKAVRVLQPDESEASADPDDDEDIVEPTPPTPSRKRTRQSLANSGRDAASTSSSANSSRTKRPRADLGAGGAPADAVPGMEIQLIGQFRQSVQQRSGKVAFMVMKNFMCHENLAINLNDRINMLIGNNGSGKSAILTALVIGLGNKATATSRSTNLTQLIKRGESSATIEIHLDNYPDDGFEVNNYGSKIIVQRTIYTTGRSVYKIKNAAGSVVSTKREVLQRILMFLNIQVDNPVCVLNQDASRSFLRDSDPAKRYQLYLKASQIETVMEKLDACAVPFRQAKERENLIKEQVVSQKQTISQLGDRIANLKSVDDMRKHIQSLQCQLSWQRVAVQEQLAAQIARSLAEYQRQYDDLRSAGGNKIAAEQLIRDEMQQLVSERDAMKKAISNDREALATMRRLLREKEQVREELLRKFKKLQHRRERDHDAVQELEKDLAEREIQVQADGMSRLQKERNANERRLAELRTTLAEKEVMAKSAQRDVEMLINTKTQAQNEQQELMNQRRAIGSQTERLQHDIAQCQTAGQDGLLIYGPYMVRLVAAIEAAYKRKMFSRMPLGPLGRYVQLEDARWKLPVEHIIGAHVQSFIVNTAADRRVLFDLFRKQFPEHLRHSIIAMRFVDDVYDVQSGAVVAPTGTRRVMDVLRVSNPVVMNCLIDQSRIEAILLTEDEAIAMRLTADEENVPTNLLRVMLLKPFSMFYPEPNYRSYSIEQRHARYLQVDVAERRGYLESELRVLAQRASDVEAACMNQQGCVRTAEQELARRGRLRQQMDEALRVHRIEIRDLEMIEYPEENDAEYFRNELVKLRSTLTESDAAITGERERLAEQATALADSQANLAALIGTVENNETACRDVQRRHDEAKERLDNNAAIAQHSESRCRAMDADLQKLRKEMEEADTKVQRLMVTAERLGGRIGSQYTEEELQRKLRVKERRVVALGVTHDTLEMLENQMEVGREALAHTQDVLSTLKSTIEMLSSARIARYNHLKHMKTNMALRVKHKFNSLLKLRNYDGSLDIDHAAKTMELNVVPRDKHIENAVSNAKSLSGGERSYSTIAFLLALWSCVSFPFYFLDEYDVFTDQMNRFYITKLLLSEAEKKPASQYTFLTPQDISDVSASDILTIHRLAEPDR